MYTIERPNGTQQAFRSHMDALNAFTQSIRVDGLPHRPMTLTHRWTADGRWCARGTILHRLLLCADDTGIWDLDGSGVPSDVAVGPEMAAQWAAQPIIRVSHDDPLDEMSAAA